MQTLEKSRTRVLIAEDLKLVSRILASYISAQPDLEVVGEATNGREAIAACERLVPDVILMDISMPGMDGISATHEILSSDPEAKVVILTAHENGSHTALAAEAGARGYLKKDCHPNTLIEVIRRIASGDNLLPGSGPVKPRSAPRPHLTSREIEIVEALAGGKSNKQIASAMFISERTVRNHASNIYRKLNVYDRTQAVLRAARHGFIDLQAVGE